MGKGRQLSLDVLRAIAIVGMMLSGRIPFGVLPPWMYHAQTPPPSHAFRPDLPGITWVDLVLPWFVFAMGAAIPLSLARQVERSPIWLVIGRTLSRTVALIAFAMVVAHTRPMSYADPALPIHQGYALLAFALMWPAVGRIPEAWPKWAPPLLRCVGWGGLFAMMTLLPQKDGTTFSKDRSDVIIMLLAWASLGGTLIWLAVRRSAAGLLLAGALLVAFRFATLVDGSWQSAVYASEPFGWLFAPRYLQYLLAVIPGLLCGNALLGEQDEAVPPHWGIDVALFTGGIALVPLTLLAMSARLGVTIEMLSVVVLLGAVAVLGLKKAPVDQQLLAIGLGAFVIGLLLEPTQGGIKKDPPTMSYLIGVPGLGAVVLVALRAISRRRWLSWVEAPLGLMGANALLAYAAINHLVSPLWNLTIGVRIAELTPTNEGGVFRAALQTALLVAFTAGFTRAKVMFRA